MESIGFALFGVVLTVLFLLYLPGDGGPWVARTWADLGRRKGLAFTPSTKTAGMKLAGTMAGVPISVEIVSRQEGNAEASFTRVQADLQGRLPSGFALAARSRLPPGEPSSSAQVETGDAAFDEQVQASGPQHLTVACLGVAARRRTEALVAEIAGGVSDGIVFLERRGIISTVDELDRAVRTVSALASLLREAAADPVRALRDNAASDPVDEVRLRNFKALRQRQASQSPEEQEAAKVALAATSPRLRLLAASQEATDESFAELSSLAADVRLEPALRAEALRNLGRLFLYERAAPAMRAAIASPSDLLRLEAVLAAGRARDASLLEPIALLADRPDEPLAQAIAETLGRLGDSRAEPALLKLLAHEAPAVRRAAADALAHAGTVAAVESLLPLAKGLFEDAHVKEAARDALRRIQARLGDADAGRLSVVEPADAAGAVSLADHAGALSLSARPDPSQDAPATSSRKVR